MEPSPQPRLKASLSDYLAAERTLLAWIRTGLALMGFGFVVARFGIFLREFFSIEHTAPAQSSGFSLWFGIALIVVGVLVTVSAGLHYSRLMRELERGEAARARPARGGVLVAYFLAAVGFAMTIYLFSIKGSIH